MKDRLFWQVLAGALILATAACAPSDDELLARGADLLAPFKTNLKAALQAGMQRGPIAAIGACRDEAPGIASELSTGGVLVGRSSHRLRNPDNAGPEWVTGVIDTYLADSASVMPVLVARLDGKVGYVEPIMIQPMCLACHGKSLDPELAARIGELYPGDRATGFREGDLRGVYWAEFSP